MADQFTENDTNYTGSTDTQAFPNHGVDGNNSHDPAKGAGIGAVGGAIVGGLAGGPVGAVIGAIAGGAASGAGVAAVDKVDNDNSPREHTNSGSYAGDTDSAVGTGSVYNNIENGGTVYDNAAIDGDLVDDGTAYGRRTTADSVYDTDTASVR